MKKVIFLFVFLFSVTYLYSQCNPPSLSYPANNEVINTLNPTLQWGGQSGNFANQKLQVSTGIQFFYPIISEDLPQYTTSYTISSGLQYNVLYYWRVGVNCYPGYYLYSNVFSFTVNLTGINILSTEIPSHFSLFQNYPNPFNPQTKIKFAVPAGSFSQVILSVYDILGMEVVILVNEQLSPGIYEADLDATNFPSGVYFYKLSAGDYIETKKMMLIK